MGLIVSWCWNQVMKLFLPALLVLVVFRNAALISIIRWEGTVISCANTSQKLLHEW